MPALATRVYCMGAFKLNSQSVLVDLSKVAQSPFKEATSTSEYLKSDLTHLELPRIESIDAVTWRVIMAMSAPVAYLDTKKV